MEEQMKNTKSLISDILIIFLFTFGTLNCGYKAFSNLSLIIKPQEFDAKILNVKIERSRRHSYCTIVFEYEENNQKQVNEIEFSWTIFDILHNFIMNDYEEGRTITICKNNFDFYQAKNQIKYELFINLLFAFVFLIFLIFFITQFYHSFSSKIDSDDEADYEDS